MARAATKTRPSREDDAPAHGGRNVIVLDENLSDFEDFEPLPPGRYKAECRLAELRIKEETGNEYFYLQFNIPTDMFPPDYDVANAPEGMNLTYARVQKPTAKNRRSIAPFRRLIRAFGLSEDANTFDTNEWVGREVMLTLTSGEWMGDPRNEIVTVEAVG